MSVDNHNILPDDKMRLWMIAQTHLMFQEGKDSIIRDEHEIYQRLSDNPFD